MSDHTPAWLKRQHFLYFLPLPHGHVAAAARAWLVAVGLGLACWGRRGEGADRCGLPGDSGVVIRMSGGLPASLRRSSAVVSRAHFAPMASPLADPRTAEALTSRILGE